jgi:hypothetical protein
MTPGKPKGNMSLFPNPVRFGTASNGKTGTQALFVRPCGGAATPSAGGGVMSSRHSRARHEAFTASANRRTKEKEAK